MKTIKPSEIKVGVTYRNRGAGTTARTVLAISGVHNPNYCLGDVPPVDELGVLFEQNGIRHVLPISRFARWCGGDVE